MEIEDWMDFSGPETSGEQKATRHHGKGLVPLVPNQDGQRKISQSESSFHPHPWFQYPMTIY
jgi:hypothetical protein